MNIIYQSVKFNENDIDRTYARLYSNGEIKFFDVNAKHKTIREYWQLAETADNQEAVKKCRAAGIGEMVHIAGNVMDVRTIGKR